MSMFIFPYLNQIFPDDKSSSLNEILDGVPSDLILKVASFVNSKLYVKDKYSTHREIFNAIVFQEGIDENEKIHASLVKFEKKYSDRGMVIFPLYVVLQLIEYVLVNYNQEDKHSNPHKELAFLKAILFLNGELDKRHEGIQYENSLHLLWAAAFPQYEYRINKNPLNEMYLAFSLFDFLEKQFPDYYENYLKKNNCSNSKELIKEILALIVNSFNNDSKLQSCSYTAESFDRHTILSSFIRDMSTFNVKDYVEGKKHLYFKGLREKPILKLLDGSYSVINWNFISDKVRQGVIFDFYNNSGIDIPFDDYKSIVGQKYSEKDLFISLLQELYGQDAEVVMHDESELDDWNFDFYLRYDNKILLFEFKDVSIREDVKNSEGGRIWKELQKKFVKNERGRAKGVTQLAKLINKLNTTPGWIEDYSSLGLAKERLIIMPIVLYTDESCGVPAVNLELSKEFKKRVDKYDFFMVYNPVFIGVNAIVEYLYHLEGCPQVLISLIHDYYLYRASYQLDHRGMSDFDVLEKIAISFDLYLAHRFSLKNRWEDSISIKMAHINNVVVKQEYGYFCLL